MWTLSRIALYPIKSLDPIHIQQADVLPGGALSWDRRFALFDQSCKVINAKKFPEIHKIRSTYDLVNQTVTLTTPQTSTASHQFHLTENRADLESWFEEYFAQPITLKENNKSGFPDDLEASGPTIISTQTYEELTRWFPDLSIEDLRLRFRANLEFAGDEAFCEDRLYSEMEPSVLFQIGPLTLAGSNPCKRCVVPSRSPVTGESNSEFMKTFIQNRKATFPAWAPLSLFQNMYRLAVNTRPPQQSDRHSTSIQVGDLIRILH